MNYQNPTTLVHPPTSQPPFPATIPIPIIYPIRPNIPNRPIIMNIPILFGPLLPAPALPPHPSTVRQRCTLISSRTTAGNRASTIPTLIDTNTSPNLLLRPFISSNPIDHFHPILAFLRPAMLLPSDNTPILTSTNKLSIHVRPSNCSTSQPTGLRCILIQSAKHRASGI
jgi:hypothetical protein